MEHNPLKIPVAFPGMRIGLFGGSFAPPHEGHLHVINIGLKRLQLDQVWILVAPRNPLKNTEASSSTANRVDMLRSLISSPNVLISSLNSMLGNSFTYYTVLRLQKAYPRVHFAWLMGADCLDNLHRWKFWKELVRCIPFAIIDRPESTITSLYSVAAQTFRQARLPEMYSHKLAYFRPPAWVFLHDIRLLRSSTELRKKNFL